MVKEAKPDTTLRELALAAGVDEKELARTPLRGLWKGISITEMDIAEAKRELFGDSFSE
jgi:hypothetical protein